MKMSRILSGVSPVGSFGIRSMSFEAELVSWLPQLRHYAGGLTNDPAWADDLVQDTAERALTRCTTFDPSSNLRAWLLAILRHLYIHQSRVHREIAVDDEHAPWCNLEAPRGEFDGLVLRDVQRSLYRLPVEQREVLLLVCVEELTYQEASSALGVPIGTVMSRLSRAREHLRARPHLRVLLTAGSTSKYSPLQVVRNPL